MDIKPKQIVVTGATGYVGGRLVPRLLEGGHNVRILSRDPRRLEGRMWYQKVEPIQGDVFKPETLLRALEGIPTAYYLINSMVNDPETRENDLIGARNFGAASAEAGVQRIIYLGWLGDYTNQNASLGAQEQVGDVLRASGVPVTEFRAAIIIGSGSLSFEIIRYMAERVPIMVCPKWVVAKVQPIGIANVIDYLVAALNNPASTGKIIEIGGDEIITYRNMITGYARLRQLTRFQIPLPVTAPALSSYWVHWVTPIPRSIARSLIDSLKHGLLVESQQAKQLFPAIVPINYETALIRALERIEEGKVETVWFDALSSSQQDFTPVQLTQEEGMMVERRLNIVACPPDEVYKTYSSLGGKRGWLVFNFAWKLRGNIDRLTGGVGMRRGRRHPEDVRVGDAIDFWRVEAVEPGRVLRLRAEMKVPGKAWLQFESIPLPGNWTLLVQTAFFNPKGLIGLVYWYALYPLHAIIFGGMVREIAQITESNVAASTVGSPP